jgi:hypothetical protein
MSTAHVPLNTAIADLDEGLRTLLKRELGQHGFEGVEIAFEAPSKEWSGKLTNPAVNLFLYDLRQSSEGATRQTTTRRGNGITMTVGPPLRLDLTYAVTSWTKAVEDEHRLLSQVLAILYSYTDLPSDILGASTAGATTQVGRPREEKADFWSAVGGQYKASIDFVVTITVESGAVWVRGPAVRTRTIRMMNSDYPAGTIEEFHGFGGTVSDGDAEPIGNAWVVMPDLNKWAASDMTGRFRISRVPKGDHKVVVRTIEGRSVETTVSVPGQGVDIVVGDANPAGSKRR